MSVDAASRAHAGAGGIPPPQAVVPVQRGWVWPAVVLAFAAPLLLSLSAIIWRTPMPLSEAVALLEDVARRPAMSFLSFDTSYYRPLYHMTLSALWRHAGSLDATLAGIKLLQIVPVLLLVVLFVWSLKVRGAADAAAGVFAVAVLLGLPAFRDNLELPLSYTTVGMPIALAVWMLLNRSATRIHTPAILALTIVAVGFKEQGLAIVPLVVAMWWMGAPGASRQSAVAVSAFAVVYVVLRLAQSGGWPLFQQEIGYGFSRLSVADAEQRFGAFPLWIFVYNAGSTVANVLLSEPTAGTFRIAHDLVERHVEPWALNHLLSSGALTALIVWSAVQAWRASAADARALERRVVVACAVVLAACGALSFNYSRDRLGGMAAPFYALAAYFAVREVMRRTSLQQGRRAVWAAVLLFTLSGAWQLRAVATLETARVTSYRNRLEWLIRLPERRAEFADRRVYLGIMEAMANQGTADGTPRPTRYPRVIEMFLHEP